MLTVFFINLHMDLQARHDMNIIKVLVDCPHATISFQNLGQVPCSYTKDIYNHVIQGFTQGLLFEGTGDPRQIFLGFPCRKLSL